MTTMNTLFSAATKEALSSSAPRLQMVPLSPPKPTAIRRTIAPVTGRDSLQLHRRSPSSRPQRYSPTPFFHRDAATGYAAALLDVARCGGAASAVQLDVRIFRRRIRTVLGDDQSGEEIKAAAVRRAAEEGGFCRHLVTLVKMLVRKGKVGLVDKVMEEFERISYELDGIRSKSSPILRHDAT